MQMIAKGKWSKQLKSWTMVVAMRRPETDETKPQRPVKRRERPRER